MGDQFPMTWDNEVLHVKSTSSSILKNSPSGGALSKGDESTAVKQKLAEEVKKREELQKELSLQKSMKAEMEMAMKLLEKDVHEKQDTIVGLRDQLDDIKSINLEMYMKLQECEQEICDKSLVITRLECKTEEISRMLIRLNEMPH